MHGILLVDKPEGITSAQVVKIVKKRVKPIKVGHSGTLDPAATGLLVILLGAGTRTLDYLDETRKAYSMIVRLGEETDTCDKEGEVISSTDASGITEPDIERILADYRGVTDQIPPHYSAVKRGGVPLYKLARQGVLVDAPARKVEVFQLDMVGWAPPLLTLNLVCSKGTYARALARDIGRDLKVGGRLEALRRTGSGAFKVDDAISVEEITAGDKEVIQDNLIPLPVVLSHIPDLIVSPIEFTRLMRGAPIDLAGGRLPVTDSPQDRTIRLLKVVSANSEIIILVRPFPNGPDLTIRPVKVFNAVSV
jgi:tRNA pseudouridine55 synthase